MYQVQKLQDQKQEQLEKKWEEERLSDENVLKQQIKFEEGLNTGEDLPDAITWGKAYVYRHLMSKWYQTLIAKHRYDDAMAKKLKSDWLKYLVLLEQESTEDFLSQRANETDDVKKQDFYRNEQRQSRQKYMQIEDDFAAAVGRDAIDELTRVREAPYNSFDRSGRKPIAPTGFHYSLVSVHPYNEELTPDRSSPSDAEKN
jgi:hypothetical protein